MVDPGSIQDFIRAGAVYWAPEPIPPPSSPQPSNPPIRQLLSLVKQG